MNGMSLIVKTITRFTLGLILLFGFYVSCHGHVSHGVGFAGGVIVALGFIHLTLAYGKTTGLHALNKAWASWFMKGGVAALLLIGLCGMWSGAGFLGNFLGLGTDFRLFSGGIAIVLNLAMCLTVAGSLYTVFLLLIEFKPGEKE